MEDGWGKSILLDGVPPAWLFLSGVYKFKGGRGIGDKKVCGS